MRKTPVSCVYKLEGKVGDMPKLENKKKNVLLCNLFVWVSIGINK